MAIIMPNDCVHLPSPAGVYSGDLLPVVARTATVFGPPTADLIAFALFAVAHSVGIVFAGLERQGVSPGTARRQAIQRTAAYFTTTPEVVAGAWDACEGRVWFGLRDLANECDHHKTPETNDLVQAWLARRGTPNTLVRPYAH